MVCLFPPTCTRLSPVKLKEALRTWKGVKSPEAVFVAACKEGRKPESAQAKSSVIAWFEWARKNRIVIVIAMSGEVVYTPDGEAVVLAEMMRRFPIEEAIAQGGCI